MNTQDWWYPRITPPAFEVIVLKDGPPTEAEMVAAIQQQFECVLKGSVCGEVKKYLTLLRSSIELEATLQGYSRCSRR